MTPAAHDVGPPQPPLGLVVGVTGHRRLAAEALDKLSERVGAALAILTAELSQVQLREPGLFSEAPPQRVLISALAEGADQLVATAALEGGWELRAVLPFAAEDYRADFSGDTLKRFDGLLTRAGAVWSLPGARDREAASYASAGEATAAQADLLIAVWDGDDSRGLGGTAEVVEYAIRRGAPVLWIRSDGDQTPVLLWSGFEGLSPALLDRKSAPRRPCDVDHLRMVIASLVAPPAAPDERAGLESFLEEPERRWRLRLEYPLLLALTGVRRLSWRDVRSPPIRRMGEGEWVQFRTSMARVGVAPGLDALEAAFCWSDSLANQYAQTYRSGLVFNYAAAAAAVVLALTGLLAPGAKVPLLLCELALIGGLIVNTADGNRRQWHRRWLDYRYLAERLRPLRSLHVLSSATPGFTTDTWRWTDWYARAMWRQLGAPATLRDEADVGEIAEGVALHELDNQVAYHRANAHRMHELEHRLHRIGTALFYATLLVTLVWLAGALAHWEPITRLKDLLTVLAAGFPTIGAALFGVRGQGDFAGAARRSLATAERLSAAAERLRSQPISLSTTARATEGAAATMLGELGEWHVSYRHRKLAIPA